MNVKEKNYLIIREPLFCMYFSIYYFALFVQDMAISNSVTSSLSQLMKLISCILLAVQMFNKTIKKSYFKNFVLGLFLVSILFISTYDVIWILLLIISFSSLEIDNKRIFKISLLCILVFTAITLFLCFVGITPDIITRRTDLSKESRHSLGFLHSSNLPLNFFYLFTYYIALHEGKIKFRVICLFVVLNFVLYKICVSNNAFFGVILICIVLLISNIFKNNSIFSAVSKLISKNIFLILFILSFIPVFMRSRAIKMEWWYYFDTVFTNRTYLGTAAYNILGIHFLNFMNSKDYFSNGIVIDNGYMYLLLRYGIFAAILFIIINSSIYKYYKNNINMLLVFIVIAAVNYTDNDFFSFGFFPFIVIGIGNIHLNRRKTSKR